MSDTTNPFALAKQGDRQGSTSAVAKSDEQRAIQEVQAAMVIAKKFPRDQVKAMDRILQACSRPTLAESALYEYPRGRELVTGPSIRLAEAIAQQWGNMQFGIRELQQDRGASTVEAFAWDVETNTRSTKVFSVPHIRHTRKGVKRLEDPRDIYEVVANNGSRRLRACILSVIPGDVIDAAKRQCEVTLRATTEVTDEVIQSLVDAFVDLGVSQEQLAAYLGHYLVPDVVTPGEVVRLRKVYQSIRDGFASVGQYFDIKANDDVAGSNGKSTGIDALKEKLKATEASDSVDVNLLEKIKASKSFDDLDHWELVVGEMDKRTGTYRECSDAIKERREDLSKSKPDSEE